MRLFLSTALILMLALKVQAESTRINVYPVSQAFVDVEMGDTLGEIVKDLLPAQPSRRGRLMDDIVQLNPHAFIDSNPDRLKAHVRLWLPGHHLGSARHVDRDKYHIRAFSWGYIQQPR